jgi:hypothetical protein
MFICKEIPSTLRSAHPLRGYGARWMTSDCVDTVRARGAQGEPSSSPAPTGLVIGESG